MMFTLATTRSLVFTLLTACSVLLFAGCQKNKALPVLRFSNADADWFIFQNGQPITFKNTGGDSIVYQTTKVERDFVYEYATGGSEPVAKSEYYLAKLENANDSIVIYFYKEYQYNANPDRLKYTIRWLQVKGQFVTLEAIEKNKPFTTQHINGVTYNSVTPALPLSDETNPWTRFVQAYYDRNNGFVELTDTSGVSWKLIKR